MQIIEFLPTECLGLHWQRTLNDLGLSEYKVVSMPMLQNIIVSDIVINPLLI